MFVITGITGKVGGRVGDILLEPVFRSAHQCDAPRKGHPGRLVDAKSPSFPMPQTCSLLRRHSRGQPASSS